MRSTKKGVDLGDAPPILLDDRDPISRYQRASVAQRWVFGFVTTLLMSVFLMLGALWATFEIKFSDKLAVAVVATKESKLPEYRSSAKEDLGRSRPSLNGNDTHNSTISIAVVKSSEEKQIVEPRPYNFILTSLNQNSEFASDDIPTYDLARLIGDAMTTPVSASDEVYAGSTEAAFSIEILPFPTDDDVRFASDVLPLGATLEPPPSTGAQPHLGGENIDEGQNLAHELEFEVESVPDAGVLPSNITILDRNVSEIVKSSDTTTDVNLATKVYDVAQEGDTVFDLLLGSGISKEDATDVRQVVARNLGGGALQNDDVVELHFGLEGEGRRTRRRVERFTIYRDRQHLLSIASTDDGALVVAKPHREAPPTTIQSTATEPATGGRPTIYQSLYQTALEQGLPRPLIAKLVRAFAFEVDLTKPVGAGDSLKVVFSSASENDTEDAVGEVLFAKLQLGGIERQIYRFRDAADGAVWYYDEQGRSTSRLLLRKPMGRGIFRSGFGMRRHPILKYRKMHNGVDWAAPRGTPIYAAGSGKILRAGWQSGFGRAVRLRLDNGYEAFYAHMSRIGDGVKTGRAIRQGEIVGYVGTSGLSTGNHLHYELSINGRRVDPLRIRLPRGRELTGEDLVAFEAERDRIDKLVRESHDEIHRSTT